MGTVMKASEFVKKLKDVAENYKTLYVMGCFGAPMTEANKKRYIVHNPYNQDAARVRHINAASKDTFGFDCVCLIKGILWGWDGSASKMYGGAKYNTKGVPDVNAGTMFNSCSDISKNFDNIQVGEALWCTGHIGVYIGNGLAVECTPAWKNKVQITAVKNIGTKAGYNARTWLKHGKLPYIEYDVTDAPKELKPASKPGKLSGATKPSTTSKPSALKKVEAAKKRDASLTGSYKVVAKGGLHIRTGAGTNKTSMGVLKDGAVVNNYGYYNVAANGGKWLYIQTSDGIVGYCSAAFLKKC